MSWFLTNATASRFGATRKCLDSSDASVGNSFIANGVPIVKLWAVDSAGANVLTQKRVPTSDVSSSGTWAVYPASPTTKFDKVAESSADDDTSYLTHGTTAGNAVFGFSPFDIPEGATIQKVSVVVRCKDATSGTNAINARIGVGATPTQYSNTQVNPAASYTDYEFAWATNPATSSPWTRDQVMGVGSNALANFGVVSSDANPQLRITQVYVKVTWHFEGRGTLGGGPISVTVPSEVDIPTGGGVAVAIQDSFNSTEEVFYSPPESGEAINSGTHQFTITTVAPDYDMETDGAIGYGGGGSYGPDGIFAASLPSLSAPTGVTSTQDGFDVDLACEAVTNATAYVWQYKEGSGAWTALATTSGLALTDAMPTGGVTLTYRVKATASGYQDSAWAEASGLAMPLLLHVAYQCDATHIDVVLNGTAPASPTYTDFTLDNGASVSAAVRQTDTRIIRLTTSTLAWGTSYTLTVSNVVTATVSVPADIIDQSTGWAGVGIATQVASQSDISHLTYLKAPDLTIAVRRLDADGTLSAVTTLSPALQEQHQHQSVFYLPDGKVCVLRGGWTGTQKIAVAQSATAYAEDFGAFVEFPALPSPGGNAVYAKPICMSDGTAFVFTHRETVAPVDMLYYRKTSAQAWDGGAWTKMVSGDVGATRYVYMQEPAVMDLGSFERLAVTWTVYLQDADGGSSQWRSTKAVGYAYTDDGGTTWRKADGTALTLPIDGTSFADTVLYPYRDWTSAEAVLTLDGDGLPYIAICPQVLNETTSPDTLLSRGLSVLHWDGSAWSESEIVDKTTGGSADNAKPWVSLYPQIVTNANGNRQFITSNRAQAGEVFSGYVKLDSTTDGWDTFALGESWMRGAAAHTAITEDERVIVLRSSLEGVRLSVVTGLLPPDAPSGFTATRDGSEIDFAWTDNAATEQGFYIERAVDIGSGFGDWTEDGTALADATSYTDSDLPETWTAIKYRVAAYNASGQSAWVESNPILNGQDVGPATASAGAVVATILGMQVPVTASASQLATITAIVGQLSAVIASASSGAGASATLAALAGFAATLDAGADISAVLSAQQRLDALVEGGASVTAVLGDITPQQAVEASANAGVIATATIGALAGIAAGADGGAQATSAIGGLLGLSGSADAGAQVTAVLSGPTLQDVGAAIVTATGSASAALSAMVGIAASSAGGAVVSAVLSQPTELFTVSLRGFSSPRRMLSGRSTITRPLGGPSTTSTRLDGESECRH